MQEKLIKKLSEKYPHKIDTGTKHALRLLAESISANHLKLEGSEYLHLINENNWNYKQLSGLLNNFFNMSFAFYESKGLDKATYTAVSREIERHIELWNSDIAPIKESIERQKMIANPNMKIAQA